MARCRVDKSVERIEMKGFAFPLGVYPIEPMEPRAGYTVTFEPADGESETGEGPGGARGGGGAGGGAGGGRGGLGGAGGTGAFGGGAEVDEGSEADEGGLAEGGDEEGAEWEEWPDRYVFDILVPATRVEALCRSLFAILPGRVYPILDVLGQDEFREVDPYVSYDLVGLEKFLDGVRRFSSFFYEDGLVGFGVMSEEPFIYIFIDEHKIVTVRVETSLREKVEAVLQAFDLEEVEEIAGADAATHEHRGVLDAPKERRDLLNSEEIVEYLRDEWHLVLNIDPETNLDDEGNALGVTGWHCIVRHDWEMPAEEGDTPASKSKPAKGSTPGGSGPATPDAGRHAEILLTASCFREAEDLALAEFKSMLPASYRKIWEQDEDAPDVPILVAADRLTEEHFSADVKAATGGEPNMKERRVWHAEWLPQEPE